MSRTEKFKDTRSKNGIIRLGLCLLLVFISVGPSVFAIIVEKENKAIKNYIYNYDKTSDVYNLQQDIKGGKY